MPQCGLRISAAARSLLLSAAATRGAEKNHLRTEPALAQPPGKVTLPYLDVKNRRKYALTEAFSSTFKTSRHSLLHAKRYLTPSAMAVRRQHLPPYGVFAGAQMGQACGQSVRRALVLNRQRLGLAIRTVQQHGRSRSIDPRAELHGDRYVRPLDGRIDRRRGLEQHRMGQSDTREQCEPHCDRGHPAHSK